MKKFLHGILLLLVVTAVISISSCSESDFQPDGGSYIEVSAGTDPSEDPTGSGSSSAASDSTSVGG
ncbi:MAG: hypothetical protein AAFQ94_20110 [Bacteroidota bacterium]